MGYTDTILDVRTQRVRSLLGLSGSEQNGSVENKNLQHLINGTERRKDSKRYARAHTHTHTHIQSYRGSEVTHWLYLCVSRSPGDVLETFNFLENAEDSDEEEDEEGDLMDDISTDKHHRAKKHKTKVHTHKDNTHTQRQHTHKDNTHKDNTQLVLNTFVSTCFPSFCLSSFPLSLPSILLSFPCSFPTSFLLYVTPPPRSLLSSLILLSFHLLFSSPLLVPSA